MSQQFFHGARVTDDPNGAQPIQTIDASVIGLLCTAPDSEDAATATLSLGKAASNNLLNFTANLAGVAGNKISVAVRNPAKAMAALDVSVSGTAIMVSLATDETGSVISTGAQVLAALVANEDAAALVAVDDDEGSGAGVVTPAPLQYLSGGKDEAFPLNTPVLVAGDLRLAARLGKSGTGPSALADIFDQSGATVCVVRVEPGATDQATLANLIGAVDAATGAYTGAQAFLSAESITGKRPMILIAPGFASQKALVGELVVIAEKLRAHVIADGPDTNDAAAIAYTQNFGSRRVFVVDPGVKKINTYGEEEIRPASATVAGLIAWTDANRGFHWSPSNQEIKAITGTTRSVDYIEADPNSRANVLNSENVATIIRNSGFRLWGNRTLSADPRFVFLSVSRVDDVIALSIQRLVNLWAVDRPITRVFFKDTADEITAYLTNLANEGVIAGGRCYPDPELNTPQNIALGKVYFDYDWSPSYPAEDIEIKSRIVEIYLSGLTGS